MQLQLSVSLFALKLSPLRQGTLIQNASKLMQKYNLMQYSCVTIRNYKHENDIGSKIECTSAYTHLHPSKTNHLLLSRKRQEHLKQFPIIRRSQPRNRIPASNSRESISPTALIPTTRDIVERRRVRIECGVDKPYC